MSEPTEKPGRRKAAAEGGVEQKVPISSPLMKEIDTWRGEQMAKTGRHMFRTDALRIIVRAGLKALREKGGGQGHG